MASVTSRVFTSITAAALAAAGLAVVSSGAATADPLPLGLVRPLSQSVTTLASCGSAGSVGVQLAGTCYPSPTTLPAGAFQVLVVDRTNLTVVANDFGTGNPLSRFASYGSDRNRFWILNAPNGLALSQSEANLVATNLDIPVARQTLPLSMIAIAGCASCPKTVNAGYALGTGGATHPAGQIAGYFQRANTGSYLFTWPDYVPFDTQVPDGPSTAPVMRVGERTYQTQTTSGADGFVLLVLSADSLEPVSPAQLPTSSNPAFYEVSATTDQSGSLAQALTTPNALVLLQSVGRPKPVSLSWNALVDRLDQLGGTRALLNSLNMPTAPGLDSPQGYAFAGLTGTSASSEATSAPANEPVALHGLLSRQRSSLFAPFLADPSGLLDQKLYEITYQPPTAFPMTGATDVAVINKIQQLLAPQGFPQDVSLRDAYWVDIADPRWTLYKAALDALTNPDVAAYPRFDIVRAQLQREFSAVLTVRSTLVDANGLRSTLDLANAVSGGTLDSIAQKIVQDLQHTVAPPENDVFAKALGIVLNILTTVAGAAGLPGLGNAAQAASATAVVTSGLLGMAAVTTEQADGGGATGTDAVQAAATEVGQRLAAQFQAAVLQMQQLASIYVSDYGKLFAAAKDFSTNPAYRFDAETRIGSVKLFAQAARQTMFQAILPASLREVRRFDIGDDPKQCFANPALSSQAVTESYVIKNGNLTPQADLRAFIYRAISEDVDPDALPPSRELVNALFAAPEVSVPFNGGSIEGAGFDPGTFLDRVSIPRELPAYCTVLGNETDLPDSVLVNAMSGTGQRARAGTPFPQPLSARLTNTAGLPLFGQVRFDGSAGGATFGSNSAVTVASHAGGIATSPTVTAGPNPLSYGIAATSGNAATVFSVVNDPSLTVTRVVGEGQEAAPDTRFPFPLVVKVTDPDGNPVPGATVTFTADNNNAWFYDTRNNGLSSAVTVVTDGAGLATSGPLHAGPSFPYGPFDVGATVAGQPGLTIAFHLSRSQTPAKPASTTQLASLVNPVVVGDPVSLQASVSGQPGYQPTGTVTFSVDGTARGTVAVDPQTGVAVLDPVLGLGQGSHQVRADYSGDGVYAASSDSLSQVVSKLAPSVTITSPSNGAAVGQELRFTATVAGVARSDGGPVVTPTGTVSFTVDGAALGAAVPISAGKAVSTPISTLDPGVHDIVAVYSGDGLYKSAQQSYVQAVLGKWQTGVTVTASPQNPAVGQPVTFTATVTATPPATGTPTGQVRFLSDFTAVGGCDGLSLTNGTGTCTTTYPAPTAAGDPHQISVSYGGDRRNDPGQSAVLSVPVSVGTTRTTVTGPQTSVVGQPVTFTADVSVDAPARATPTGTVSFLDHGQPVCDAVPVHATASSATATCSTAFPHAGSPVLSAVYSGDSSLSGSTAPGFDHTVAAASSAVTLTMAPEPSVTGQAVVLSTSIAVVAPGALVPGGTVRFSADGTDIPGCTAIPVSGVPNSGHADCIITFAAGAKHVVAAYSGTSDLKPGSASGTHQVGRAATSTALTAEPTALAYGKQVRLVAAVAVQAPGAGQPGGTVTFFDGTAAIGSAQVGPDGTATLVVSTLPAGSHHLRAEYAGSTGYQPSAGAVDVSVSKAATTLNADQATRTQGSQLFTVVVTVSAHLMRADDGRPVGAATVIFTKGSAALCTAVTSPTGVATCSAQLNSLSLLLPTSYTATFAGDANYLGSVSSARL